ncbi:cytochrome c1 [Kangiella spongicola]|jgi:ubiquinol-cytochrome c reductase cytochrome c1 subunit|uniref:Cytochrome c1 n=1 Tax=Kangiella spongicola TaxID=796379 RepID=A0A318D2Y4_9GAMM|nr:cytochrome c1 [Kangiella spongicola]MBV35558.1 cytochrome c1 [Rickettsiales bacterium]PXF63321.1 cytochrome c1 [Kangiella spongicola]
MKKLISAILFLLPVTAFAAGGEVTYPNDKVNVNYGDKASLQNGAKLFVNYCQGCHSMEYVRYSRVAQDLDLSEEEAQLLILGEGKLGDTMDKSMDPDLAKKWFGVNPLDLSMVARVRGNDWVYNYLRAFYIDKSRPFDVNNTVFPGVGMPHILADLQGLQMKSDELLAVEEIISSGKARIDELKATVKDKEASAGAVEKAQEAIAKLENEIHEAEQEIAEISRQGKMFTIVEEGSMTPEEYDHAVRDLVAFMAYTANPVKLKSKEIGLWSLLFLLILLVLAYFLKKEFWKDIKKK